MPKTYSIRDPIHGFIDFGEWERDIINHPVFQRLRRIRQLAWTDMVYPGGMHTRFEHSLGVMHLATRIFETLTHKNEDFLKNTRGFDEAGFKRDRVFVRLAALLHDVGHAPFSHSAEGCFPKSGDKSLGHEDYSGAIIRHCLTDVIDNHPMNQNYGIKASDIADFVTGRYVGRQTFWRTVVSGQIDADRADYLLRDSHHLGVAYGKFDLERLISTLTVVPDNEKNLVVAVEDGGRHAVEQLIIARYMMFTQVYYHKVRRAYDYHLSQALSSLLSGNSETGVFPAPESKETLEDYLHWDDWKVLGLVSEGKAGYHGGILLNRTHHRMVLETSESPSIQEIEEFERNSERLGDLVAFVDSAEKVMYKFDKGEDIPIVRDDESQPTPLSLLSRIVKELPSIGQKRIYVRIEDVEKARRLLKGGNGR